MRPKVYESYKDYKGLLIIKPLFWPSQKIIFLKIYISRKHKKI